MKFKTVLILSITLLFFRNINAQSSDQAILTYKLAQEEFEKRNFKKSYDLLNEVEDLDPNSIAKVAFLKAKIFETYLFQPNGGVFDNYLGCMQYINTYLEKGSDENKKNELLMLKIKIEHDDFYQVNFQIKDKSKDDLSNMIVSLINGREYYDVKGVKHKFNVKLYCNAFYIIDIAYDKSNTVFDYGMIILHRIDFQNIKIDSDNYINISRQSYLYKQNNLDKRIKKMDENLSKFINDGDFSFSNSSSDSPTDNMQVPIVNYVGEEKENAFFFKIVLEKYAKLSLAGCK